LRQKLPGSQAAREASGDPIMLQRFTERARQVMALANQEAQRFHNEYIGAEHLLLGILKEGNGIAASVLKDLDVDSGALRGEIERQIQTGSDSGLIAKLPQTPQARKVLDHAIERARQMHHNYVGTEHLLLGLLLEPDSIAAKALAGFNVDLARAHGKMMDLLSPEAAEPTDSSSQLIRRAVECLLRAKEVAIAEGNTGRATELQEQLLTIGAILTRNPQDPQ
jgi:ATP-dependent Clp protease ATP-binding subunit ClpC